MFRLSRIDGPVTFTGPAGAVIVPAGTDVRAAVRDWDADPPVPRTAGCAVRAGAGYGLRLARGQHRAGRRRRAGTWPS